MIYKRIHYSSNIINSNSGPLKGELEIRRLGDLTACRRSVSQNVGKILQQCLKWVKVIECGKLHFPKINIAVSSDRGCPGGGVVKDPPANVGDTGDPGSIFGLGRSLKEEEATHSSILWEAETTSHLLNLCGPLWLLWPTDYGSSSSEIVSCSLGFGSLPPCYE